MNTQNHFIGNKNNVPRKKEMNIRIHFIGGNNDFPRKKKKKIKNALENEVKKQIRECMETIYKEKKAIQDLKKIPVLPSEQSRYLGKERFIYSEAEITREDLNVHFPNKIVKYTNYFLGKLQINTKDILFLINVGNLFFTDKQHYIWPSSNVIKMMYVTIN
ncbi:MAG: hypothetical protein ACD_80C00009G0010 [uncultured bacterium (gcode 4)]|uniref:Uncharacterized protein n=1 Tax=uncultured bacterium (gcode 4) TaxID=1234023 RepID=K1X615_9BACT|nr:MAG: hypothetical protein ACD_80C00009G0010 [uncultured bacterium (gcode 4)]HBB04883.1 hypothetical protein [Candidatus Gracilibacteria bacterium]